MPSYLRQNIFLLLLPLVLLACILLRPPLPVDETRYLTVAWEMWLKNDWIHLSYNFEPYHHKPPFLFWLINMFWSVFGIGRVTATLPSIISAVLVVVLTGKLAEKLFPSDADIARRAQWMIAGSLPLLVYGSLIMFDTMMTVWVLACWIFIVQHAAQRKFIYLVGLGLCMGMGVLTKGPVMYIHVLVPALLAPLCVGETMWPRRGWYGGVFAAVLISLLPVLVWIGPLAATAEKDFLYWLLWKQSAGRVTGGFSNAHIKPLYFYLPFLPLFFLPWILFPSFWVNLRARWKSLTEIPGFRFILFSAASIIVLFSLITGKQPHYMMPLVPAFMIGAAFLLRDVAPARIQVVTFLMMTALLAAHGVASRTIFPLYDWQPIADIVARHPEADLAYVRNYNGEFGYLARLERPLTSTNQIKIRKWFKKHPDGLAVIRYKNPKDIKGLEALYIQPYRGNSYAGVFRAKKR